MKKLYLLVCLFLASCTSHTGNNVLAELQQEDLQAHLITNKTTTEDVRGLLGDPLKTKFRKDSTEEWVYELTCATAKATNFIPYLNLFHSGANTTTKTLRLLFNEKGVLIKYNYSASEGEVKHGLM